MRVLLLGATGMLGQSLTQFLKEKGITVDGVARKNADINLDVVTELEQLKNRIIHNGYDVVINTVALINLKYCNEHPEKAYLINTYVPAEIAELCERLNIYFIQISTDHYYTSDKQHLHNEEEPIILLNEYARTKYLAENLTLMFKNTLVIRTNIIGFRNHETPTFIEWVINNLENNQSLTGYSNMYTSSIDTNSFSIILYELLVQRELGLWNIAAEGVLSKYELILQLAQKFNKVELIAKGQLPQDSIQRGNSLGLSIKKLKKYYPDLLIPTVTQVVENIYEEYIKRGENKNELS